MWPCRIGAVCAVNLPVTNETFDYNTYSKKTSSCSSEPFLFLFPASSAFFSNSSRPLTTDTWALLWGGIGRSWTNNCPCVSPVRSTSSVAIYPVYSCTYPEKTTAQMGDILGTTFFYQKSIISTATTQNPLDDSHTCAISSPL